ncbi:MAG: hypothetical protein WDN45_18995 [Caulobacteraceae bacterium]
MIMAPQQQAALRPAPLSMGPPGHEPLQALGWKPATGIAEGFRRTILGVEEALEGA